MANRPVTLDAVWEELLSERLHPMALVPAADAKLAKLRDRRAALARSQRELGIDHRAQIEALSREIAGLEHNAPAGEVAQADAAPVPMAKGATWTMAIEATSPTGHALRMLLRREGETKPVFPSVFSSPTALFAYTILAGFAGIGFLIFILNIIDAMRGGGCGC